MQNAFGLHVLTWRWLFKGVGKVIFKSKVIFREGSCFLLRQWAYRCSMYVAYPLLNICSCRLSLFVLLLPIFCHGQQEVLCPSIIGIVWPAGLVNKDVASKITGQSVPTSQTICSHTTNMPLVAHVFIAHVHQLHITLPLHLCSPSHLIATCECNVQAVWRWVLQHVVAVLHFAAW